MATWQPQGPDPGPLLRAQTSALEQLRGRMQGHPELTKDVMILRLETLSTDWARAQAKHSRC